MPNQTVNIASPSPVKIGTKKQLFLDELLVESKKGVTLTFNPPYTPQENLLIQDKPWEKVYAFGSSVLEYEGKYHLWYSSYGGTGDETSERTGPRLECYAFSTDGVHWEKPNLGLIPPEGITPLPPGGNYTYVPRVRGNKDNNIVMGFASVSAFIDPFDDPSRRFKTLTGVSPTKAVGWDGWAPMKKVAGGSCYLSYSPDGIHWDLITEPFLPFGTGGLGSTVWDENLQKWVVYLRASTKGHKTDPWGRHIAFARIEVDKDKLIQPYPFTPDPNRKRNVYGSYGALENEFPIVYETDDRDPAHQVYTFRVVRYREADLYLAFPSMWYPNVADKDDAQFAFSRDGIHWQRPFRQPIVRLGMAGSGREGYIDVMHGMIRRGNEMWLYYTGLPERHLSPTVKWESIIARAIYRLDGFISEDGEYDGGELITRPMIFAGTTLELNLDTSAGGWAYVELQDENGGPIRGYSLKEADKLNGNAVNMKVSWGAKVEVGALAGKAVKVRFVLRNCKLYAFQFV